MSEPTTLNLYSIHSDRALLTKLHELQVERLAENELTGGDRPTGMRLSIADPVRRVKAAIDEFWSIPFDDGVGARGHLLEDYLEVALFHDPAGPFAGMPYVSQVSIQWHEHGRSAFDFVARGSRVISCKTSIKDTKPSSANVDQERRMMALAALPAGSEFDVWMIDPSTFRATGPHTYTLEQEHIDAALAELEGVDRAFRYFTAMEDVQAASDWNDPVSWQEAFGLESTSAAFRYTTLDASGAIEARNRAFLRARYAAQEAKRAEDEAKALIRSHVMEQVEAATAAGEQVKSVRAYSGDQEATYTIDKRGAMRVTVKDFVAEGAAA